MRYFLGCLNQKSNFSTGGGRKWVSCLLLECKNEGGVEAQSPPQECRNQVSTNGERQELGTGCN